MTPRTRWTPPSKKFSTYSSEPRAATRPTTRHRQRLAHSCMMIFVRMFCVPGAGLEPARLYEAAAFKAAVSAVPPPGRDVDVHPPYPVTPGTRHPARHDRITLGGEPRVRRR